MPYKTANGILPSELASKIGHTDILKDRYIKDLIEDFESIDVRDVDTNGWKEIHLTENVDIDYLWVVDGSLKVINSHTNSKKRVGFIKVGMSILDNKEMKNLDREHVNPKALKDVLDGSMVIIPIMLPLQNIKSSLGSNIDAIRHILMEIISIHQNGILLDTLKYLMFEEWDGEEKYSTLFSCPKCGEKNQKLEYQKENGNCTSCKSKLLIIDTLDFHTDMEENSAPDLVLNSVMRVFEHLLLLSPICMLFKNDSKEVLNKSLFLIDGPLMLPSQYSRLIPKIRNLIKAVFDDDIELKVLGQEKSGRTYDYLEGAASSFYRKKNQTPSYYKLLTHGDYYKSILHRELNENVYGSRTNWGEKVLLLLNPYTKYVLNIPPYEYIDCHNAPNENDIRFMSSLISIVMQIKGSMYENSLFPIELINNRVSLSDTPTTTILSCFIDGII